jgi:hypothetical protein
LYETFAVAVKRLDNSIFSKTYIIHACLDLFKNGRVDATFGMLKIRESINFCPDKVRDRVVVKRIP